MARRYEAWLSQAKKDLELANSAAGLGRYEWACFAAQQGAEKAVQSALWATGAEAWGHSVSKLLASLPAAVAATPDLIDAAKDLDRHYIPSRYPNAHPEGAPHEHYTQGAGHRAIANGGRLVEFCEGLLAELRGDSPPAAAGSADDVA